MALDPRPDQAILYHRLSQVGTSEAMPPLAKNKLDDDAVTLINDWIVSLGSQTDIEPEDPTRPEISMLQENYPNPFATSTTIGYELPQEGAVKLTVYDMQGREVKVLVDAFQQAGVNSVTFDAANLPSGTYLYQLDFGKWRSSKKMMLVR